MPNIVALLIAKRAKRRNRFQTGNPYAFRKTVITVCGEGYTVVMQNPLYGRFFRATGGKR